MKRKPWYQPAVLLENVGVYGTLVLTSLFAVFPILWSIITSLKDQGSIVSYPPKWIPNPVVLDNFQLVIYGSNMPRYFLNSLVVALATIVVTLVVASHGGYSAARFNFPFKNVLLFIILATVMIPGIAVLVPLYMIAAKMGLNDTYWVLIIIYSAWQIPTVLWLMRGFFESIPKELDEAALIDGCGPLQAFYRIIAPLTQPGLAAAAVIVFVYVWNEFIIALTMTSSDDMRLIPIGLYYYVSAFGVEWGKLMAAVTVALIPVLILFIILQRRFIQGLTSGASKG
ncbi:MAG: carbohydrate ABC transporter permease [Chloroflexi bacterium]|nr:carbohydrate ABC transporter permease [Chloroflexota bacterium]